MDKEIKELTRQRDLAQSRIQDLLRSTTENRGLESGTVEAENQEKHYERRNSSNSNLDFAENAEDNFLLDGTSPRLSIGMSSKLLGPDSLSGWEITAPKILEPNSSNNHNNETEVICKDVRCIEIDEPRLSTNDRKEELEREVDENENEEMKEEKPDFPDKREGEIGDIDSGVTYDSLQEKIQAVQNTINCLVSLYPVDRSSPSSLDMDTASTVSSKVTRSRSCRTMLMGAAPYSTPKGSDDGFSGNLETSPSDFSGDLGRKHSSSDFTELSSLENGKFAAEENREEDFQLKQVDDQVRKEKTPVTSRPRKIYHDLVFVFCGELLFVCFGETAPACSFLVRQINFNSFCPNSFQKLKELISCIHRKGTFQEVQLDAQHLTCLVHQENEIGD